MSWLNAATMNSGIVLILILIANGSPIFARKLMGERFSAPIDRGLTLKDGHPLFGPSKTWRGVMAALLCTVFTGAILAVPVGISLLVASTAMLGDLFSSFVKRRLGIEPSGMFTGVDQIPESLLPALAVGQYFALDAFHISLIVLGFFVLNRGLSVVLYKLNIRRRPF